MENGILDVGETEDNQWLSCSTSYSSPSSSSPSSSSPSSSSSSSFKSVVHPLEFKRRLNIILSYFEDFDDEQRTLLFQHLFPSMGASQFHWMSNQFSDSNFHTYCPPDCLDLLRQIPIHVFIYILSYLDPISLARSSQVNRYWKYLASSESLWKKLCSLTPWKLSTPRSDKNNINSLTSIESQWKSRFVSRYKLKRSWLKGQCHVRTFEGHSGAICCIQVDENIIVSGSTDTTIRVWNIKTNSPWAVMTLTGHSGEVRCLHLVGNRLVSGSADQSIKVWDLDITPQWSSIGCRVTMVGHTNKVRCILMNPEKQLVISGSYDETVKIWDLKTGECLLTLLGHSGPVLCIHWLNNHLLSGSADKTIKQWSIENGNCVKTIRGHLDAVTCISLNSDKIITGSLDRSIKLWNLSSGDCISTLDWVSSEGHTGVIRTLQADDWRIVSAADDKTIKVWSLDSGERLVTLRSHSDGVTCLQFNDFVIVSGSYDKTVKLWDFTVC